MPEATTAATGRSRAQSPARGHRPGAALATPLSALLLLSGPLAALLLPASCWQDGRFLLALAALAGMAWWLVYRPGLPLMRQYGSVPVRRHLALQWWCACGVLLLPGAVCAQLLAADFPSALRDTSAAVALALWLIAALPLPLLYRPHLTAADDPAVTARTTSEELKISAADGVHLHARLYRPRAGPTSGLLVFTHGLGGWKEGFLNHLRVFSEAGWAVLAYDLRGCGRSSASAITYGAHEAADLVAVWQVACRLADGLPMAAAGASMGASVTILAGMQLGGCRGFIIESPFADLDALLRRLMPRPLEALARSLTRLGIGVDPSRVRPLSAPLLASGLPLLIGWIGNDRTIPASESAAVAAGCAGARTVIMERGEHLDMILFDPWWRAVHALLAELAAQPGQPARGVPGSG